MSVIPNDGLSELKAALQKRAAAKEQKSRNSSLSDTNEKLSDNDEASPDKEEVFVESKLHHKGSKVYKNHGWKYSRSDSCASVGSSHSMIVKEDVPDVKIQAVEDFKEVTLPTPVKEISQEEKKKFIEQKYSEIIELLNFVGIEANNI